MFTSGRMRCKVGGGGGGGGGGGACPGRKHTSTRRLLGPSAEGPALAFRALEQQDRVVGGTRALRVQLGAQRLGDAVGAPLAKGEVVVVGAFGAGMAGQLDAGGAACDDALRKLADGRPMSGSER